VTTFRSLFHSTATRSYAARSIALGGCLAAILIGAAPAGALVTTFGSTQYGVQQREASIVEDGFYFENAFGELKEPATFANVSGRPVVHGSNVYVIYWDPAYKYHGDWQEVIDRFVHDMGAGSGSLSTVFAVDTQYTDTTDTPAQYQSTYRGAYTDTHPYPVGGNCADPKPLQSAEWSKVGALTCLTDAQVQEELRRFVTEHGLPTGMHSVFYMLTPPGATVCLDSGGIKGHCSDFAHTGAPETKKEKEEREHESKKEQEEREKAEELSYRQSFCSYHSAYNPGEPATGSAGTILYGVIPWTAGGLADGQFTQRDQVRATECQDGAFDPSGVPMNLREKSPTPQEPNQVKCPSPDGYCDKGLADLIVNQLAVEQQNIVTNPLLNAWQDKVGNESTDECRNFFAPIIGGSSHPQEGSEAGTLYNQLFNGRGYYVNTAFNFAALRQTYPGIPCLPGIILAPHFTAPNAVNAGDIVGFNGMESNITLNSADRYTNTGAVEKNFATYTWSFGDGSAPVVGFAPGAPACETPWLSPCAASEFHSYQYGGTYTVTLTVTDVGGNNASYSDTVSVAGPPPPPPAPGAGSGGPGGAGGSGGSTSKVVPAPSAAAAVISKTLRLAVSKGLAVRYSVNEQVAGRFEVLLSSAAVKHLRITNAPVATGLPAADGQQRVIARAVLVTTQGGTSTIHIFFPKATAARLAKARSASLMLRLIVRNAASSSATVVTVITGATLAH